MARAEQLREHIDEVLADDRRATDERLKSEREQADASTSAPLDGPRNAHDSRNGLSATNTSAIPEAAETLAHAAGSLAEAAEELTRAAHKLNDLGESTAVEALDEVASTLQATAERVTGENVESRAETHPPNTDEPEPVVAGKLAQVAESLGVVAATLADERVKTDATLREERERLDETIAGERRAMDGVLADEREAQRRLLEEERRHTDIDLAKERADTDHALDETVGLLADEQDAHGAARDMMVTRDEFLAIVSHDLRTPLSVITVSAAIIAERLPAEAAPHVTRAVERIQRSADQMGRMLSDLLDATRFEHGKFRLSPRVSNLVGVVEECAAAFEALAESHGVSLSVDAPAECVRARFDHDRILQVLSNLVRNALQFTGQGGAITLRVRSEAKGSRIDVTDTGSGIAPADLERIFERFQQSANADRHGLGLGLYISRAIVEAHGGKIWAENAPGQGTTVSLTLPESAAE